MTRCAAGGPALRAQPTTTALAANVVVATFYFIVRGTEVRLALSSALIGDIAQTPLIDVILGDLKASTPAASTRWGW